MTAAAAESIASAADEREPDSPIRSAEGYRIVWVYSSLKTEQDQHARQGRIEKGILALEALETRLRAPRCRFRDRRSYFQEG